MVLGVCITFINNHLLLRQIMKATIANFRSSRTRQTGNQMVVLIDNVKTRSEAEKLVGKSVVYKTEANNEIKGKVSSAHGNSGALRVLFEKGMPGQSLTKQVEIL